MRSTVPAARHFPFLTSQGSFKTMPVLFSVIECSIDGHINSSNPSVLIGVLVFETIPSE